MPEDRACRCREMGLLVALYVLAGRPYHVMVPDARHRHHVIDEARLALALVLDWGVARRLGQVAESIVDAVWEGEGSDA